MNKIWNLEEHNQKTALEDEVGAKLTYHELNQQSQLLAQTIGHRCLVFSLCRNEIGSVLGYTAFVNNGIVPVMVNSHLEEMLLGNLLSTYQPEFLWVPIDQVNSFPGMKVEFEAYKYALLRTDYGTDYPLYDDRIIKVLKVVAPQYGLYQVIQKNDRQNKARNRDDNVIT